MRISSGDCSIKREIGELSMKNGFSEAAKSREGAFHQSSEVEQNSFETGWIVHKTSASTLLVF